jgi:hypothetical protein
MSTQYYNDSPATSQPDTSHRAPRPGNQGPSWYRVWAMIIGAVIAAALIVVAAASLTHHNAATSSSPAASSSASAPAPAPSGATPPSANPAQPTTPAAPAVVPSASVKKLQQELGQLNYYEGAVDGVMGPQTTAAIKDLQRQANLPQTGTMNAATQAALNNFLAHGNNQMAG